MYHKYLVSAMYFVVVQCLIIMQEQAPHHEHHPAILKILVAITGVSVIALGFLGMRTYDQSQQIAFYENELTSRASLLNKQQQSLTTASSTIATLQNDLAEVRDDLEDLADDYTEELDRNDEFEDQIRDLAGTLDEFEKLNEIDEELLAKYSKVSFLNENYIPASIRQIDDDFILPGKGDQYFHGDALKFLEDMIEDAEDDDIDLKIISAYRSFDEQTELKGQFTQIYGEGANAFSADQGFSEHQLGTAVDLTTPSIGGTYQSFGNTEEFEWLEDNAYKYGFILSYPEGNEFYIYEPWHWRFVGRDLARDLNRSSRTTFYTMDQRDIDQYLLELFD